MTIRIQAGEFRGRLLKTPKNSHVRPTTSIVKKSFFDICKEIVDGARFLDLFAGSGAVGIEALSRGASHGTFVDSERSSIVCIEENLRTLKVEEKGTLLRGEVLPTLRRLEEQKKEYDLIYIDPPYGEEEHHFELLSFLDASALARRAYIFIEESSSSRWTKEKIPLTHHLLKDVRRFGRSALFQYIPKI
jgi:16S rRNA (guanine966-N2)-methyltransferase